MNDVRDALHTLAASEPTPDLAGRVIAGANRRRRRNVVLTTAVSVGAVVAVSLPAVVLRHDVGGGTATRPAYPPPSTGRPVPIGSPVNPTGSARPPVPGGGPMVLDTFYISAAGNADQTTMLLNRATGKYVELPYGSATLSPDGALLAVQSRGTENDAYGQVGVISRADALSGATSRVHWLVEGKAPVWSPDGSKLLVDTTPAHQVDPSPLAGPIHRELAVFTVGDWHRADLRLSLNLNHRDVPFGWTADGTQLVVPLRAPSNDGRPVPGDMQYVNLDGTLGRQVHTVGDAITDTDAYSPSRQLVIVGGIGDHDRVVDAATWHTVYTDAPGELAGWYDEQHVIRIRWAEPDSGATPYLEVVDLSGHVTKQVPMPGNTHLAVQFRSSAGLTGAAAKLGF